MVELRSKKIRPVLMDLCLPLADEIAVPLFSGRITLTFKKRFAVFSGGDNGKFLKVVYVEIEESNPKAA